jgi:hypothetical protein
MSSCGVFAKYFSEKCEKLGVSLKHKYNPYDSPLIMKVIDFLLLPSDIYKVSVDYKNRFGIYPNIVRPISFNDHIQHYKLFGRKNVHKIYADKIKVRDHVARVIGSEYLNELLWVGTDIRESRFVDLPNAFVIKANNGSGLNIIVNDINGLDWDRAHEKTQAWMLGDLSLSFAEWQYRWIKPMLLIEKLLLDSDNEIPIDYKYFCFNGYVQIVQLDLSRFKNHARLLLNRNFEVLPITYEYPKYDLPIRKPDNFEEMIMLAEKLAGDEPFIRIDFYDVGRPVFGEMTLHPGAGRERFSPHEWDLKFGEALSISQRRRSLFC